jgi:superfamily II DNA/RNA helicase
MSQGSFPYQIVVGTPGKITDLVKARVINMREIKIFVLDEADAMLDQQGLKDQTMRVHAYVAPLVVCVVCVVCVCVSCTTAGHD